MDISNIYFKKTKVLKYLHKTGLKLVGLEINKGINDENLRALHGSVVELHGVKRLPVSELLPAQLS